MQLGASLVLAAGLIACVHAFAQSADSLLGATVNGLYAAGRQLSPVLWTVSLETADTAAKPDGAHARDDQRHQSVLQEPGCLRDVTDSRVLA
jgi:hypothetical protein